MTPASPVDGEACLFESADNFSSLDAGKPGHSEICWMPTSSSGQGWLFSASRQS
jgi:hypothetical protein